MKTAISLASLFHLPPQSNPFLSPFSAEVDSRHLNGASERPPAVFKKVHREEG